MHRRSQILQNLQQGQTKKKRKLQLYKDFNNIRQLDYTAIILRADPRIELRFRVFGQNPDFVTEAMIFPENR